MDERNCNNEELQRITLAYVEGRERGDERVLEELVRTYPQYASDLVDFAIGYYFTEEVGCDETVQAAIARDELNIEHQLLEEAFTQLRYPPALTSLLAQGRQEGHDLQTLADELDLGSDVVVKLEQRMILQPPEPLLERLANTIVVNLQVLRAFFAQPPTTLAPAGTLYYASQPPKIGGQQTFAEAVRASRMMTPDQKARWLAILGERLDSSAALSSRRRPKTRRGL